MGSFPAAHAAVGNYTTAVIRAPARRPGPSLPLSVFRPSPSPAAFRPVTGPGPAAPARPAGGSGKKKAPRDSGLRTRFRACRSGAVQARFNAEAVRLLLRAPSSSGTPTTGPSLRSGSRAGGRPPIAGRRRRGPHRPPRGSPTRFRLRPWPPSSPASSSRPSPRRTPRPRGSPRSPRTPPGPSRPRRRAAGASSGPAGNRRSGPSSAARSR